LGGAVPERHPWRGAAILLYALIVIRAFAAGVVLIASTF